MTRYSNLLSRNLHKFLLHFDLQPPRINKGISQSQYITVRPSCGSIRPGSEIMMEVTVCLMEDISRKVLKKNRFEEILEIGVVGGKSHFLPI